MPDYGRHPNPMESLLRRSRTCERGRDVFLLAVAFASAHTYTDVYAFCRSVRRLNPQCNPAAYLEGCYFIGWDIMREEQLSALRDMAQELLDNEAPDLAEQVGR